jgi:hypothetical protein
VLHRLLNVLTVLSLLLGITATVAWFRSYSTGDVFSVARVSTSGDMTSRRHDQLQVASGAAVFSHRFYSGRGPAARSYAEQWARPGRHPGPSTFHQTAGPDMRMDMGPGGERLSFCGFHFARSIYPRADGTICLAGDYAAIPLWAPVGLAAALPALRFAGWFRRRRRPTSGHCAKCDYDLRASSGRCPECGAAIPSAAPALMPPPITA